MVLYPNSAPIIPKEPEPQLVQKETPPLRNACDYGYEARTEQEMDEILVFVDENDEEDWVENEDISDFLGIYFFDTLQQE